MFTYHEFSGSHFCIQKMAKETENRTCQFFPSGWQWTVPVLSKSSHMGLSRLSWPSHTAGSKNYSILHCVRKKKRTNSILGITSSNTGRFSKFFQCHNLLEICNKTVKFPTTPQTRCYTTCRKTDVRKLVNQRDASHHFVA